MRARVAATSVGLSLALHAAIALRLADRRTDPLTAPRQRDIELTTFQLASPPTPRTPAQPTAAGRLAASSHPSAATAIRRRPATSPVPPPSEPPSPTTQPAGASNPPEHADLFARTALERAVSNAPIDPGGHLRRATDPADRDAVAVERDRVAARVREMVDDERAKERAASGNIAPRWRDIERKLAQSFRPPVDVVKQENVVKALAHQILRSGLDGPPQVGPVARGFNSSVQTLPGTPEGMNLRSLPLEQALTIQARWGEPATSLRVEVEVEIDEEGRIIAARVVQPSGRRAFDRTALAAVEEAVRAGGAPDDKRPVRTRWSVEAAVAVAPPTAIGFRFDETGHLNPGATGIRKYLGGTYPMQQTVQSHVSLIAIEPR